MPAGRGRATAGGPWPACQSRCRLLNLADGRPPGDAAGIRSVNGGRVDHKGRMEGEELRAAAVQHRETVELRSRLSADEISTEQINHAARDAHSKLY
eukprot:jgi/Tetstr1/444299/TSEL_032190.t1